MQAHNPFFPKHTMRFKSSGGPSIGGASLLPKSASPKDVLRSGAGVGLGFGAGAEQTKNYIQGKGFVTDEKARENARADDLANVTPPLPNTQAASMASLVQAQQDLIQKEASKKSIRKTIFAGETGGFGGVKPYGSAATGMAGKAF